MFFRNPNSLNGVKCYSAIRFEIVVQPKFWVCSGEYCGFYL